MTFISNTKKSRSKYECLSPVLRNHLRFVLYMMYFCGCLIAIYFTIWCLAFYLGLEPAELVGKAELNESLAIIIVPTFFIGLISLCLLGRETVRHLERLCCYIIISKEEQEKEL